MFKLFCLVSLVFLLPFISFAQNLNKDGKISINENTDVTNIKSYITEIDDYVKKINLETKDNDTLFAINQLKMLRNTHSFTKNSTEKKVAYSNNKIVKEKYTDFLENNFIKIRSFYYQNNLLVCVTFFEIRPIKNKPFLISKRKIYYNKGELIFDTKQQTTSNQITAVFHTQPIAKSGKISLN